MTTTMYQRDEVTLHAVRSPRVWGPASRLVVAHHVRPYVVGRDQFDEVSGALRPAGAGTSSGSYTAVCIWGQVAARGARGAHGERDAAWRSTRRSGSGIGRMATGDGRLGTVGRECL